MDICSTSVSIAVEGIDNQSDALDELASGMSTDAASHGTYTPAKLASEEEGVPAMPQTFYTRLDEFLSRPAPSLDILMPQRQGNGLDCVDVPTTQHKYTGQPQGRQRSTRSEAGCEKETMFPAVPNGGHMCASSSQPSSGRRSSHRSTPSNGKASRGGGERPINEALLAQAFAYAERLERTRAAEEQLETLTVTHVSTSASGGRSGFGVGSQLRRTRSHTEHDMVSLGDCASTRMPHPTARLQKARSFQTRRSSDPAFFTTAGTNARPRKECPPPVALVKSTNVGYRRAGHTPAAVKSNSSCKTGQRSCGPSSSTSSRGKEWNTAVGEKDAERASGLRSEELDRLVKNFETQATLHELRKELQESQENMSRSEAALQRAAQAFYSNVGRG